MYRARRVSPKDAATVAAAVTDGIGQLFSTSTGQPGTAGGRVAGAARGAGRAAAVPRR